MQAILAALSLATLSRDEGQGRSNGGLCTISKDGVANMKWP